ncbi:DUF4328 domain-containing protein [Yinghuangia soli]|uniref:DUF4328 domain-containing protein n=1 Tax=Yinghuangia soli TaxID=2908204 RepID=A0AA41PWP0_9ACTN|nr:DUF4328 domain-containing protein [Yinghuangia soli]MCF2527103.1 DUF4328 domain-containing protein [Yinghuangia soli]
MSAGISEVSPSPRPVAVVRPLKNWARAASVSVGVVGTLALFSAVVQLKRAGEFSGLGQEDWDGQNVFADPLLWFAWGVPMMLLFAAAIPFIVWFHRARANVDVIAPGPRNLGKGMAIGGWFIPLASAVIPAVVAHDTWKGSVGPQPADAGTSRVRHVVIWGWALTFAAGWFLYGRMLLARSYAGEVESGEVTAAEYFDAAQRSCVLGAFSGICLTVAAVFAVTMVHRITTMQSDPR